MALAPNGGRLGECSIPANRKGYSVLQDWALELGSRPVFAVEGTGSFGAGLCRELLAVGYSVVEINRPDRSTRRRLGKDDAIDAEAAARSFLAGTATIAPKGGTHLVEMIRLLKGNKDSASKSRTRAINQIKAILVTAPAVLREQLEPLANDDLMVTCTAFRVPLVDSPMAAAKRPYAFLPGGCYAWSGRSLNCWTTSTSSPNRPALASGRPTASAPMVPPPCSLRWAIIPSDCVQMQRLLLSVASAPCTPVRVRPIVIASIAVATARPMQRSTASLSYACFGTSKPRPMRRGG